ncbi:ROK family protein [Geodermatophilus ruber]|uniref:ROK family protein (Putative glucokinase) n=1 Tax=Geodermatophilus ruber TaxID=504800 RepID=A0A1I3Z989_9ACTN|nr:ROK family protein [Geodermatophilus ruber]SFK40644.1 ROK family protein (putative glucokinase) [Geodermatophilus ruber]
MTDGPVGMAVRAPVSTDQLDGLVTVLDLVRGGRARSRPELARASGLGRGAVTQRVTQLLDSGLLEESELGRSTGGRPPRELAVRAQAGLVLVAPLGATHVAAGVTDLTGRLIAHVQEPWSIAAGPDAVLTRVEELFRELLARDTVPRAPVYGIGIGLPGPVEFATGTPVNPPIMPGWDGYRVRARLAKRFDVPVWVDNDVNLMALGELRTGAAQAERNVVYVKIGTGIGAGLISDGRLHRGAKGAAGDIGHATVDVASGVVCRCGNVGCLEALAGGAALSRDGTTAATEGRSPYLRAVLDAQGQIGASDVAAAAQHGDTVALELLTRSGRLVGETVATLVNFFNPSLVLLGGGVALAGDVILAAIRQAVYQRSLPLATRDLRIDRSLLTPDPALPGAAHMVLDELFSRQRLGRWLPAGSPAGFPELAEERTA